MKFQHFIRSQAAGGQQPPETTTCSGTLVIVTRVRPPSDLADGDRGIPKSWRHMNGYSSHTYSWVNAEGELFWVKYHFKDQSGSRLSLSRMLI